MGQSELTHHIPKTIHLCWFSGDKFPAKIQKCIDSWKAILPDFRIKLWTREMAEAIGNTFINEALSVHKWAFAADVVRLYALYTDGGVYMDSDILLINRFDEFMDKSAVLFQEYYPKVVQNTNEGHLDSYGKNILLGQPVSGVGIQAAFMISQPKQPLIKAFLDIYEDLHFILPDGSFNTYPVAPARYAMAIEKYGYRYTDTEQVVLQGTIYPSCYVAGHRSVQTSSSFAVHLVAHSWRPKSIWQKLFSLFKKK